MIKRPTHPGAGQGAPAPAPPAQAARALRRDLLAAARDVAVQLVSAAVTAVTYAWKRHMLLSMGAGTLTCALMLALTS